MKKIDAHTSVEGDHVAQEGDYSVCFGCGTISKFDAELNLVPLVQADMDYLKNEAPKTLILLQEAAFQIQLRNAKN